MMGNIPPGMGYRNRSELSPTQSRTLHYAKNYDGFIIMNGNERRTAQSLVNKGYAIWMDEEQWIKVTLDGIDWCNSHDTKGRIK